MVNVKQNLIDQVWGEKQPDRPRQPIVPLDLKFTGRSWETKVDETRQHMKGRKVDVLVLSALDDTAWLLNLRGADIKYNPVFFGYTAITEDQVYLFVNEEQLESDAMKKHLGSSVEIKPYGAISEYLSNLKNQTTWLS